MNMDYLKHWTMMMGGLQKPIEAMLVLNMKTLQSFHYLKPSELSLQHPQEMLDKQMNLAIDNSHRLLDYMQESFSILEHFLLSYSQEMQSQAKKTLKEVNPKLPMDMDSWAKNLIKSSMEAAKSKTTSDKMANPKAKTGSAGKTMKSKTASTTRQATKAQKASMDAKKTGAANRSSGSKTVSPSKRAMPQAKREAPSAKRPSPDNKLAMPLEKKPELNIPNTKQGMPAHSGKRPH